ncbi:MAG: RnfABCDGE type electron transport complex subunit G [Steroidobacteraceae bacterium]
MATDADRRPVRGRAVLAAGLALAAVAIALLVHHWAAPRIAAHEHAARVARLASVLGATRFDNDVLDDVIEVRDPERLGTDRPMPVYRARLGGRPVAALIEVIAPGGYGGSMRLLVAVRPDGRLIGVRVVAHHETPGVGDGIEPGHSDWLARFVDRALGDPPVGRWGVRRDGGDFDQYTGATVTSRAVVGAVRDALGWYDANRTVVFTAPPAPGGSD